MESLHGVGVFQHGKQGVVSNADLPYVEAAASISPLAFTFSQNLYSEPEWVSESSGSPFENIATF